MPHVPLHLCERNGPLKQAVIACFEDGMLNKDNVPLPKFCLPEKDIIRSLIDWLDDITDQNIYFNATNTDHPQVFSISSPEFDLLKKALEENTHGRLILLEWQPKWAEQIRKLNEQ